MLLMFFLIFGVDQDVINEYNDKLVQLRHEHRMARMMRWSTMNGGDSYRSRATREMRRGPSAREKHPRWRLTVASGGFSL
jgi:hypothetical protein